jgi:formylglycine-generating enzyme required for sulfatase activity
MRVRGSLMISIGLNLGYMKTRSSEVVRFLSVLCLAVWALAPRASAQPRPSLGLRFSGGQPTLSLTGEVGSVYSIQYATGLSPTNLWVDRTLLQAQGASNLWTDPSAPSTGQRFYRAVSVPAPADTNLVFIQPGTFTMGSPMNEVNRSTDEGPQTAVTISRGFWMGKFLVTQGDYLAVIGSNPSHFTSANGYSEDLTRPVETVTWFDATNYCAALTQRERAAGRIPADSEYRLPTEAEWEYACRAGTTTRFSWGDDPNYTLRGDYAWSSANSGGQTHPVGQKKPSVWGMYDVNGNVWEWCRDWYGAYPGGTVSDPIGVSSGSFRGVRGGSWGPGVWSCRSALRGYYTPDGHDASIGFRILLAPSQP